MKKLDQLKYAYDEYAGRILTVCIRYCRDIDTAQDLMQDTFIQAYNNFDKFSNRGVGSLRAWLEKIAVNTCLQYLRKKDLLRDSKDISNLSKDENLVSEMLDEKISTIPEKILLKFIGELPNGYRTIFNLYVFEEYSHKEIANMLGINEKSSSSQFYRAKTLLAKKIKEYEKRER
jgi:RNA polymerase sigma factor, sigma-70 family